MPRQRYLATGTAIALAFALGITFSSLDLTPSGLLSPLEQCAQTDKPCAAALTANETARIAWWTRFDAIFSIFAGAAALFAFLAYRQTIRQANAAEASLEQSRKAMREQLFLNASEKRAILRLTDVTLLVSAKETDKRYLRLEIDFHIWNRGLTQAYEIRVSGVYLVIATDVENKDFGNFDAEIRPHTLAAGENTRTSKTIEIPWPHHIDDDDVAYGDFAFDVEWKDISGSLLKFRARARKALGIGDDKTILDLTISPIEITNRPDP